MIKAYSYLPAIVSCHVTRGISDRGMVPVKSRSKLHNANSPEWSPYEILYATRITTSDRRVPFMGSRVCRRGEKTLILPCRFTLALVSPTRLWAGRKLMICLLPGWSVLIWRISQLLSTRPVVKRKTVYISHSRASRARACLIMTCHCQFPHGSRELTTV